MFLARRLLRGAMRSDIYRHVFDQNSVTRTLQNPKIRRILSRGARIEPHHPVLDAKGRTD
jgi:hypothetical protein